jgi:hypothetical protein
MSLPLPPNINRLVFYVRCSVLGEEGYELRNNCGKYFHTLIGIPSQGTCSADNFSIDLPLYTVTLDAKYEFTFSLNMYINRLKNALKIRKHLIFWNDPDKSKLHPRRG